MQLAAATAGRRGEAQTLDLTISPSSLVLTIATRRQLLHHKTTAVEGLLWVERGRPRYLEFPHDRSLIQRHLEPPASTYRAADTTDLLIRQQRALISKGTQYNTRVIKVCVHPLDQS